MTSPRRMSGGLVDSRPAHGIGCFRAFLMSFFRHRALAAVVRLFVAAGPAVVPGVGAFNGVG